ncbi:MAG: acetylxylan esterase [bacterium]
MPHRLRFATLQLATLLLVPLYANGQAAPAPAAVVAGIPVNYDESKVGTYTLPDPLVLANGKPVRDAKAWFAERRPELVKLFEENQFGRAPGRPADLWFRTTETSSSALDGRAVRRQVTVYFTKDSAGPKVDLLLYLPSNARGPSPVLLNVSFTANANTIDDAGVTPGMIWGRDGKRVPAPPPKPGPGFGRLNPLPFLAQGIGVATLYYGDIDPDFAGGAQLGVRSTYLAPGQTMPAPNEWGTIAAWAWGVSRVMDYLETNAGVDAKRVALVGVSRIGKTVLWAGARDTRFAIVIASCSGESGAALSRRNYGETVAHMTAPIRYAYQFAANYGTFGNRVNELPMDGHMLVSLIAPRPVLLQTGDTDFWSDPKGEFLSAVAAGPVFTLLGARALDVDTMPSAGQPVLHTLGYYMHSGGHGTIPSDWDVFLTFLQMHWK